MYAREGSVPRAVIQLGPDRGGGGGGGGVVGIGDLCYPLLRK